jgi:hypothetical protein
MTNETKGNRCKWNAQEWFRTLDRFNAVEPFVFEREQPEPSERDPFSDEDKSDVGPGAPA